MTDESGAASDWRREAGLYAAAVAVTYPILFWVLRLSSLDLRVPLNYSGDANFHGMVFKTVLDRGWYEYEPRLGAPFGQRLHDFPLADNLHMAVVRVFSLFTDDYAVVLNSYYLLTFGLAAAAAVWAFRRIPLSRPAALVCAVLFAVLPYPFTRGVAHFFLAADFPVPLAVGLVLIAMRGGPLLRPRDPDRRFVQRFWSWRTLGLIAVCAVIGSSSSYYAAFSIFLLLAAGVMAAVRGSALRLAATAFAFIVVIAGAQFANQLPDILYARQHGANTAVANRSPVETEVYSLKLAQLVLPVEQHRVDRLAALRGRYLQFPVPSEGRTAALGALGALGFLWLLAVPVLALFEGAAARIGDRYRELSVVVVVGFVTATTGGLSSLAALAGTAKLRAWSRMSIFIAVAALGAVGLFLDGGWPWVRDRLRLRRPGPAMAVRFVVLAGVLLFGVLDQTTPAYAPDYAGVKRRFSDDAAFARRLEQTLPAGAMVFQMPFWGFPESGARLGFRDYDHVRPFLHTKTLRWTYGAVKGRPESDWQRIDTATPEVLLPALAASGFDAVYIDKAAYLPPSGEDITAKIAAELGGASPIAETDDKRLAVFDLRTYRARLAVESLAGLKERTLYPARIEYREGFRAQERNQVEVWRWTNQDAELVVVNPGPSQRRVTLRLALAARSAGWRTTIRLPDGTTQTHALSQTRVELELPMVLRPGDNVIRFDSAAPAGFPVDRVTGGRYTQVLNPSIADDEIEALASAARGRPA